MSDAIGHRRVSSRLSFKKKSFTITEKKSRQFLN